MKDFIFNNDKSARDFIILSGIILLGIGLFSVFVYDLEDVFALTFNPEIDQNQVEDEISRTIIVKLEDGISSSDDLQ